MSCLADTNVLLRYVQQNHDMHGVAVAALDFLLGSGEIVVIVPQNITEFWNVCTRPTDHNGLGLTPSETDKQVSQLESLFPSFPSRLLSIRNGGDLSSRIPYLEFASTMPGW